MKPNTSIIRIGISRCLLGERVRWDANHKRDPYLNDILAAYVTWVSVCPEVEAGMEIPREPVRLERSRDGVRMVGSKTGVDHTAGMKAFSRRRVRELQGEDLSGFVLKKGSPSCGMERVKVYGDSGAPGRDGIGLFARELMDRFPLLPVEEEGRLHDPVLRENFIERVFTYWRWKRFLRERYTVGRLVRFHTVHKFLILSHSPEHYRELGRIVAGARKAGAATTRDAYGRALMEGMARRTTRRKHANVLFHMTGFFKKVLDGASRSELTETVDDYRKGIIPLIVPVTLIRHHARVAEQAYLQDQVYLYPHPKELMLRNHV